MALNYTEKATVAASKNESSLSMLSSLYSLSMRLVMAGPGGVREAVE